MACCPAEPSGGVPETTPRGLTETQAGVLPDVAQVSVSDVPGSVAAALYVQFDDSTAVVVGVDVMVGETFAMVAVSVSVLVRPPASVTDSDTVKVPSST